MKKMSKGQSTLPSTSQIPGGRALAQYVAHVVVTNQRREWEPLRSVVEGNKKRLRQDRGNIFNGARCCVTCTRLEDRQTFNTCPGGCNCYQCDTCRATKACETCSRKCQFKGCSVRMLIAGTSLESQTEKSRRQCIICSVICCPKHSQYCPGCGCTICWHPTEKSMSDSCVKKHDCQEKREKIPK